jgi:transposase
MPGHNSRLIPPREAAKILGISYSTLKRWIPASWTVIFIARPARIWRQNAALSSATSAGATNWLAALSISKSMGCGPR